MTLPAVVTEIPSCGVVETFCICCLPNEHDGEHLCGCGGSWTYDEAGEMIPHTYPGGITLDDAKHSMARMINGFFAWPGDDDYYDDFPDAVEA